MKRFACACLGQTPGFVCGFILMVCLMCFWPGPALKVFGVPTDAPVNFEPVADLGGGWYLVEVQQEYTCDNPLPLGNKTMTVVVPHLVRMRATELDNLIP